MIQVLEKVSRILTYISQQDNREVPLTEIADKLGINRGTCANILQTLLSLGLVEQSGFRSGYVIGDSIYSLAGVRDNHDSMVRMLKPLLDKLCMDVNENIMLAVIKNGHRILPYTVKGNHQIEARTIEDMNPWSATTAKVIMAYYSDEQLSHLIRRIGMPGPLWPEIKTRSDLDLELSKIRESGICTIINHHFACIAAPVFRNGEIAASIGAYLPDIRLSDGRRENLESKLLAAAKSAGEVLSR